MLRNARGGIRTMRNSEKAELRSDVRELSSKGYSRKEGVKTLVELGYSRGTAYGYWHVFALKQLSEEVKK